MRWAAVLLGLAAGCARSPAPDTTPGLPRHVWDCRPSPCGTRLYDGDGGFIVQACPDFDAAGRIPVRDLPRDLLTEPDLRTVLLGDDDAAPPPGWQDQEPPPTRSWAPPPPSATMSADARAPSKDDGYCDVRCDAPKSHPRGPFCVVTPHRNSDGGLPACYVARLHAL
jgi:hypothetical protein